MRKYEKKGKKAIHGNLDDEQKEHLTMRTKKRKKKKKSMRTLVNEKNWLRKYKKKGKKTMHNNLGHDGYKQTNRLKK